MKSRDRQKNHRVYSKGLKGAVACLQALCIAIIAVCVMTLSYWTEGTFHLSSLSKSFEESPIFLNDVEKIVRGKIDWARNRSFFEKDGAEDLKRKIDIHQYVFGVNDTANQNENTTFLLADLINFYPRTGRLTDLLDRLENSGDPSMASFESLSAEAQGLDILLPISGRPLDETAKLSDSPYTRLRQYYSDLCRTSADLHDRYQAYTEVAGSPEGERAQDAPGNISYFVENTETKAYYTNLEAKSSSEAKRRISDSSGQQFVFEGVRTMNIMVANTEHCLNQEAVSKFIDTDFLGANERVVLAYSPLYEAGDLLHEDALAYQSRKPAVIGALAMGLIAFSSLLILLVIGCLLTGRQDRDTLLEETWFDQIPAEIAAGIAFLTILVCYYGMRGLRGRLSVFSPAHPGVWPATLAVLEYLLLMGSLYSVVRRARRGTLLTNTVIYTVARVSRQVTAAKVTSRKLLTVFILFIAANFVSLLFFHTVGLLIALVMDLALLLYLLRDQVGKLSVKQGLLEISKGHLDYKIDTHGLMGDSLEMALAVNEMGDGLQEAVESMVKNERLKAELVTNVSHDLKTPLTSVINYVDLLRRLNLQDPKAREYLEVLDGKSQRLKALISDLIDASKISSGNIKLDMAPLDLRALLLMTEGEFEERLEEKDLTVRLAMPKGKIQIQADGSQLYRVFDNLFSNIAKYARRGSQVTIQMEVGAGEVTVSFGNESDDFLDMSGEELQERFVRGDLSRGRSEGSGLGLSIARSLTELMGGSFHVQTEGYTYLARVTFPLLPQEQEG